MALAYSISTVKFSHHHYQSQTKKLKNVDQPPHSQNSPLPLKYLTNLTRGRLAIAHSSATPVPRSRASSISRKLPDQLKRFASDASKTIHIAAGINSIFVRTTRLTSRCSNNAFTQTLGVKSTSYLSRTGHNGKRFSEPHHHNCWFELLHNGHPNPLSI